jgi:hypothetical protein
MKVDELRVKLYQLKQDEVIRLAVEFYKLVPKAKKEEYNLDGLVNAPEVKTAKPAVIDLLVSFEDMATEVETFIEHAKNQNYLFPNKVIAKKDRPNWRFKVKGWYKDVTNPKTFGFDMGRKAEIGVNLYDLLCEACHYQYFSSDDPFNSVGVEQTVFFRSVLQLIDQTEGKLSVLNRGLEMAIHNATGPNTMPSSLMQEFVTFLEDESLRYDALEKVEKKIAANQATAPTPNPKKPYSEDFSVTYRRNAITNHLAEMGFRLYASLLQYEKAIVFYNKYAIQNDSEIKLYILIRLLFERKQKTHIQSVLEAAAASGERIRASLTKLLATIHTKNELPEYFG